MFQGDEPGYPTNLVEIMSDHHLRDTLGLQDGDTLEFTVIEASGESGQS
jgi:CTP-dependent riboflavin kinase